MELLAPNGNISNLTAEQYRLVRTDAFKRWFGDWENDPENASKVVDENGEPLVVYHGSVATDIEVFDRLRSGRISSGLKELGIYFSTNKALAELYSKADTTDEYKRNIKEKIKQKEDQLYAARTNRDYDRLSQELEVLEGRGRIYPVFLNLRKIHTFDANEETNIEAWRNLKVKASYKTAQGRDAMEFLSPIYNKEHEIEEKFGVKPVDGVKATNIIDMSTGGYGVNHESYEKAKSKYLGDAYLVFDGQPQNIKLADGSNITFDGKNPDIRYYKGGEVKNYNKWKSVDWDSFKIEPKKRSNIYRLLGWYDSERIDWLKAPNSYKEEIEDVIDELKSEETIEYIFRDKITEIEKGVDVMMQEESAETDKGVDNLLNNEYKTLKEKLDYLGVSWLDTQRLTDDELLEKAVDNVTKGDVYNWVVSYFFLNDENWLDFEYIFDYEQGASDSLNNIYHDLLEKGAVFTEESEEQQYDMFAESPAETMEDLTKQVNALIEKKKKLYPNPDIESPMSADEKQLDKDIAVLWDKINQLIREKQKIKSKEKEDKILNSGVPIKQIKADELQKGDLIITAYDKFSVADEVKVMPRTTKVFYSTFYDGYNNDKSLFWTFKNYDDVRVADLEKGQLIAQISSKGGADVTNVYYEVNKHGAYASIKGEGRSGTANFNKKDIDSALGYNWREYQPKVNIDVLGILGSVKTADDFDNEKFEKRLSKRYSDVNKLAEDYKDFDDEKGQKFGRYEELMKDAIELMNAGSGTPRVVYKELGLNDFINKRADLKTIKQFDKFLDEAIVILEKAIVTSLERTDDAGISLMGDKYDEFVEKYPQVKLSSSTEIKEPAKKSSTPFPHLTKTAKKKLSKNREGIIVNLNGMKRGQNTLYKYAENVEEAYKMALNADLESYQIWYIYPNSKNETISEYTEAWLFPDDFEGDLRDDKGRLTEEAKAQAILETKKQLGIEVSDNSLEKEIEAELEILSELLEDAKEEDTKELISELEDRIEFLEELKEEAKESDSSTKLLAPNGKPSNLTPKLYELVRTPEFKEWFGDWENDPQNSSKVVDENGEPKVVYHGGDKDSVGFTVFNTKRKYPRNNVEYEWIEFGAFFTDDLQTAEWYAHKNRAGLEEYIGEVRQFFLDIRKPLIFDNEGEKWYTIIPEIFHIKRGHGVRNYTASFERNDGFIIKNIDEVSMGSATTYHIKDSRQAKLADGSNTTFNPRSKDVTKEIGGKAGGNLGQSRLLDLPESSVIALNNHLIGLSLQISELIQARIEYLENMSEQDYLKLKEGSYNFEKEAKEPKSYEEWVEQYKAINKEVDEASDAIQRFSVDEMGLTPQTVKDTEEYKVAKAKWNSIFKKFQDFNLNSPKEFKRRQSKERRESMMSKNKKQ